MARIPEERKQTITAGCFEMAKFLVEAEKAGQPLIKELREIENKLKTEGVRVQNGRAVETPGVMHLDDSRIFLKYAKQTLQTLANTLGVMLEKDFEGPHFHRVRDHAVQRLGENHPVSKLLTEDQDWIKEIIDLRGKDEHPKPGKPFVRGFNISPLPDKWLIDPPRFINDALVLNRLEVYSHNLLTFCEEMIVHSLADFFPKGVTVYEIPETDRNPEQPVRFKLGWMGGFPKPI